MQYTCTYMYLYFYACIENRTNCSYNTYEQLLFHSSRCITMHGPYQPPRPHPQAPSSFSTPRGAWVRGYIPTTHREKYIYLQLYDLKKKIPSYLRESIEIPEVWTYIAFKKSFAFNKKAHTHTKKNTNKTTYLSHKVILYAEVYTVQIVSSL